MKIFSMILTKRLLAKYIFDNDYFKKISQIGKQMQNINKKQALKRIMDEKYLLLLIALLIILIAAML